MAIPLEAPITGPFRILIIVAHADDIEFGVGGSVAVWTDAGAEVVYCIVTDGSAGSNDPTVNTAELIIRRQEEQRAAAAHVGVSDIRFLNYPDGTLQPTIELRRELTRLIRDVRPDRVVIMDPTSVLLQRDDFSYINHPDHRAVGEASIYAVFPSAETRPIFPELLAEGLEPHHVWEVYFTVSMQEQIAVDITGTFDRKMKALLEHKSQVGPDVEALMRTWDTRAGAEAGVPMAETFRVMRFGERNIAPGV